MKTETNAPAKTEPQHTPTPWRVTHGSTPRRMAVVTDHDTIAELTHYIDADGETVRANAEFIVRAVNAHDELVRIVGVLLALDINLPKNWNRDEDGAYTTEESETDRMNEIMRQVRAAIAKAEGK